MALRLAASPDPFGNRINHLLAKEFVEKPALLEITNHGLIPGQLLRNYRIAEGTTLFSADSDAYGCWREIGSGRFKGISAKPQKSRTWTPVWEESDIYGSAG